MDKLQKFDLAYEEIEAKEATSNAMLLPEGPEDEFQKSIKDTAKVLLKSIKDKTETRYKPEPDELAKMVKAVCDLQNTFYGKDDKLGGSIIMTNQLSVFKGMLK